jgi:protein TonB
LAAIYADRVSPGDRLSLTFCLAIIIHALVVLGVTFVPEDHSEPRYDSMEIVLVQHSSDAPEEADYLAQANQEGGGDSETDVVPATPLNPPLPSELPELAAAAPSQIDSPLEQAVDEQLVESPQTPAEPQPMPAHPASAEPQQQALVAAADVTELPMPEREAKIEPDAQTQPQTDPQSAQPAAQKLTAAKLINNSFAIASLSASIERRLEASAQRPRRKFISANTREYKFASYMEAWRAKVERVGNLNYPEEARRRHLAGHLILEVVLRQDGSVEEIVLRRSSGHAALDDAAIRIVKLASPFAPFPDTFRDEVDRLHITRTWRFMNNYRLSSR